MLFKHIMSLYRGDIPEEGRVIPGNLGMKADILARLGQAMPFMLTGEALDLVADLSPEKYDEWEVLDRLRDFRLPAPMTWLEFEAGGPVDRERIGVLMRGGSGEPLAIIPFMERGGVFYESLCMLEVDTEKNRVRVAVNTTIQNRYVAQMTSNNYSTDYALQRSDELKSVLADVAAMGAVYACEAVRLMSAKNRPIDGQAEPLMSRQERRALARKGMEVSDTPPALTRIVLNAEGRAHMNAMRDTEDGRPRRAHWVRGHLMRTPTKGPVWRSAHVRGFGDPVMTPRVVTKAPDMNEPDDGNPSP